MVLYIDNGDIIRKGAGDAVVRYVKDHQENIPNDLSQIIDQISKLGGTPFSRMRKL